MSRPWAFRTYWLVVCPGLFNGQLQHQNEPTNTECCLYFPQERASAGVHQGAASPSDMQMHDHSGALPLTLPTTDGRRWLPPADLMKIFDEKDQGGGDKKQFPVMRRNSASFVFPSPENATRNLPVVGLECSKDEMVESGALHPSGKVVEKLWKCRKESRDLRWSTETPAEPLGSPLLTLVQTKSGLVAVPLHLKSVPAIGSKAAPQHQEINKAVCIKNDPGVLTTPDLCTGSQCPSKSENSGDGIVTGNVRIMAVSPCVVLNRTAGSQSPVVISASDSPPLRMNSQDEQCPPCQMSFHETPASPRSGEQQCAVAPQRKATSGDISIVNHRDGENLNSHFKRIKVESPQQRKGPFPWESLVAAMASRGTTAPDLVTSRDTSEPVQSLALDLRKALMLQMGAQARRADVNQ